MQCVQRCLEVEPQSLVIFLWTTIFMRLVEERMFFPCTSPVPSLIPVKRFPLQLVWKRFHNTLLSRYTMKTSIGFIKLMYSEHCSRTN